MLFALLRKAHELTRSQVLSHQQNQQNQQNHPSEAQYQDCSLCMYTMYRKTGSNLKIVNIVPKLHRETYSDRDSLPIKFFISMSCNVYKKDYSDDETAEDIQNKINDQSDNLQRVSQEDLVLDSAIYLQPQLSENN